MKTLPPALQLIDRTHVRLGGRKLSYFGGCDYFRMASHPEIVRAAQEGAAKYGLSVAASRMTSGNHPLYARLEKRIAQFFGVPSALLLPSGYLANLALGQALKGQFSHVLIDERAHVSLADAALMLDCPILKFKHRSVDDLARAIRRGGPAAGILVLTDGMFAHDGAVAPLKAYLSVLPRSGFVLVDDAHGAGVLGKHGRGTPEQAAVPRDQIIQTITLSKAFGVYGAAILGPRRLRQIILEQSLIFGGATPLPLPLASAALRSIEIVQTDLILRRRLAHKARYVHRALQGNRQLTVNGPIISVASQDRRGISRLRRQLIAAGIFPSFIQYPGGPPQGFFRFAISSEHSQEQLDALIDALQQI